MNRRTERLRVAWTSLRQATSPQPLADAGEVAAAFGSGGLGALTPHERSRLPAMSRCVGCGVCALVIRRAGYTRLPDLASAYLRDAGLLSAAAPDLRGGDPGADALAAAAAVCPVGVPLDELAVVIRRIADPPHEIRTPGHPQRSEEGGAPRFRGGPGDAGQADTAAPGV